MSDDAQKVEVETSFGLTFYLIFFGGAVVLSQFLIVSRLDEIVSKL